VYHNVTSLAAQNDRMQHDRISMSDTLMTPPVIVYLFQVRATANDKWQIPKTPMTIEEARDQYGAGNFRVLLSTKQVRTAAETSSTPAPEPRAGQEATSDLFSLHAETVSTSAPAESLTGASAS
jgi:hypothetical protein